MAGAVRVADGWTLATGGGGDPFLLGLGKAVLEDGVHLRSGVWAVVLVGAVSALTGGAALRVVARVWFGDGPRPGDVEDSEHTSGADDPPDTGRTLSTVPWTMLAPIAALLGTGAVLGLLPASAPAGARAARSPPARRPDNRVRRRRPTLQELVTAADFYGSGVPPVTPMRSPVM